MGAAMGLNAPLRHIVLLGFSPQATGAQIETVERAFCALVDSIPGIDAFEWGRDVSPEGLARGHSHCFVLTFADEAARDAYLPHPAHQAFVKRMKPILATVTVLDYAVQTVR